MARLELSAEAERDLVDVYLHGVERYGPAQAERYAEALSAKIATAAANPTFGVDYGAIRAGLRRIECVAHSIYYRPTADGIRVLRILHARMDPVRRLG